MNDALVLLILLWAGFLVPRAIRVRNASPHATVGGFERAMDVLRTDPGGRQPAGSEETHMARSSQRTGSGRRLLVPNEADRIVQRPTSGDTSARPAPVQVRRPDPVLVRRERWFIRSLIVTGVSLLLALVVGGWAWPLLALSFLVTGGYVAVLRHLKLQRDEARRVVAELDLHRSTAVIDVTDRAQERVAVGAGAEPWAGSSTVRLRRWDD